MDGTKWQGLFWQRIHAAEALQRWLIRLSGESVARIIERYPSHSRPGKSSSMLLAGVVFIGLLTTGKASHVLVGLGAGSRLNWGAKCETFDVGILQLGTQSPLDPRLAGAWYWEAQSVYVPGTEALIKAISILTIDRDGGFILQEEGNILGGVSYRGRLVQQGDTLTGCCDDGQTFTTRFALDGSNGLWVAGRLYGRQ